MQDLFVLGEIFLPVDAATAAGKVLVVTSAQIVRLTTAAVSTSTVYPAV